ncbi:penicillin-binding transpeptidase domain-containing protein [Halobacillus sp. GSS1]|uniref:penicillin-binding transpeptidase domain-containing protein n=1 Tax=Halobacillus sp. GSS1 TaxID=2815919 RepID=UPI001A8C0984|nr:penicillin-binding transpeptidase domain-containing protein [Halobacillus sp. GSS1]MBN9654800.1 penicillin-binding transpeptidase domain-containing protein [Halobacillus sp. GSS1]
MKWWRFMFVGIGIILLLAGCSDQPRPEDAFQSYMDHWENGEYGEMYELLSENSKQSVEKEKFIDRYTSIYEEIVMENLSFTYELPEEDQEYQEEETVSFDYEASMDSLAGVIEFSSDASLVFEEGEDKDSWVIKWDPSMIVPEMEEGDTVRATPLRPERGEIFDANGQGLAVKGTVREVGLVPGKMEKEEELIKGLAEILGLSVDEINEKLNQSWVEPDTFVPLARIPEDDEERSSAIEKLPRGYLINSGIESRVYPLGESAAHLTGYMADVTAEDLKDKDGYLTHDRIGRDGLEEVLEARLRGELGWNLSIYNSEKEKKSVLAEKASEDGEDVTLTISAEVQKTIFEQLKGESGSAAAIHPMNGDVLGLVSAPSYNPNAKTLGLGEQTTLNKFNSTYSPGSTFKPITAAIGLEQGVITPEEELSIKGTTYEQNGYTVTRVAGAAEDEQVNLRDALVRSDNIYFARKILEIGGETFLQETREFGFGEDLPLIFPIENSQLLNGDAFERDALLGDTGFGQGEIQMSSLHLTLTYTPFVTGGDVMKPRLVSSEEEGQVWHEKVMSEETASIIKNDLKAVVDDPAGTAYKPVEKGLNLAGKTGTAELKKSQEEDGQENGWFIAWDTENRDLMVSMMIEEAEGGSHYVVPKVKDVFSELQ